MPLDRQLGCNSPKAHPPRLRLAPHPLRPLDYSGPQLGMALAPLAFALGFALTLAGRRQLRHQARFLKLRKGRHHLAHHDLARIIGGRKLIAAGREHLNSTLLQRHDSKLLHQHMTREPVGILDDHSPHAIAFDVIQQGSEGSKAGT